MTLLASGDHPGLADDAIQPRGRYFYHYDAQGTFAPLVWPQKWLYYTRDSAVMTPRGVIVTRFGNYDQAMDATLMEFVFRYAPELARYPLPSMQSLKMCSCKAGT